MMTKTFSLLACAALLCACGDLGANSNDTSFERQGVQTCTTDSITAVGTATDPVRCGPQAQPLN